MSKIIIVDSHPSRICVENKQNSSEKHMAIKLQNYNSIYNGNIQKMYTNIKCTSVDQLRLES